jgi:hypothetical protein
MRGETRFCGVVVVGVAVALDKAAAAVWLLSERERRSPARAIQAQWRKSLERKTPRDE